MRTLVQPPPSMRCNLCGGELRLKLVEPANRTLNMENEIFVCTNCGRERSWIVEHDKHAGHFTTERVIAAWINLNCNKRLDALDRSVVGEEVPLGRGRSMPRTANRGWQLRPMLSRVLQPGEAPSAACNHCSASRAGIEFAVRLLITRLGIKWPSQRKSARRSKRRFVHRLAHFRNVAFIALAPISGFDPAYRRYTMMLPTPKR